MKEDKRFDQREYAFYGIPRSTRAATVSGHESNIKPISVDRELARSKSVSKVKRGVPINRKKRRIDKIKQRDLLQILAISLVGSSILIGINYNYIHNFNERSDTYDSMIATVKQELSSALDSKEDRFLAYDTIASSFGLDLADEQDSDYIIYMTDNAFEDGKTDFVVMNDLAGCDSYDQLCLQHGYTSVASDSGIPYPDKSVYYNYMQAETEQVIDHLLAEKEVTK